jgi:hypothetical protein
MAKGGAGGAGGGGAGLAEPGWRPPALPSVDGLSLQLRPFEFVQRFADRRWLLKRMRKHYLAEVRRQVHRILLHTDVASIVTERSAVARAGRGMLSMLTSKGRAAAGGAAGLLGAKTVVPSATTRLPPDVSIESGLSGRLRPPRALMGPALEVRPYSEVAAVGWHYLHQHGELAGHASGEPLVCCVRASARTTAGEMRGDLASEAGSEGTLLLLTDVRLCCVRGEEPLRVLWQLALREVVSLDNDPTDPLSLHIELAAIDGGRSLHLMEEASVEELVDALMLVVDI